MTSSRTLQKSCAFTLVEILVALGVLSIFAGALLTIWTAMQTSALNMTSYARRQNDQMRVTDYLKRDIRRASSAEIYSGGTLVTGTAFGSELRITIPHYYSDSNAEDLANGQRSANIPTLVNNAVSYGTPIAVRYYVSNGAIIREESGARRILADAAGAFTLSFCREATGKIRSRTFFGQGLRSGSNRTLRRQFDVLCEQRSRLRL